MLISNSGFPEPAHFSGLVETFRRWIRGNRSLSGAVCCAGGAVLQAPELQEAVKWYLDATRQAGREVVTDGRISEATQALLDRPLVPDGKLYAQKMNEFFESLGLKRIED